MRVHLSVVEVVVALRVGAERRIVLRPAPARAARRCASGPSASPPAAPAPPASRRAAAGNRGTRRRAPGAAGRPDSCRCATGSRAAAARRRAVFVGVAEEELARLQRRARARGRHVARPFDHRLRQPVAVAEVIVRVVERRRRLQVERRRALRRRDTGENIAGAPRNAPLALRDVAREQDHDRVEIGAGEPADPVVRMVAPVSPRICARAAMPCRNSSGNVASDASSTPSARRPFQVKATVTQRDRVDRPATRLAPCRHGR